MAVNIWYELVSEKQIFFFNDMNLQVLLEWWIVLALNQRCYAVYHVWYLVSDK